MNSTGRRSRWPTGSPIPQNPLTARVMINRIWHYHFGHGIVATPSDFGVMGDRPTNPKLLDYLAATFVENGWSIKKMHRLIMLSNAYQAVRRISSRQLAAADPDNKLLWRYERHRVEAEAIRDSMLVVSGLLEPEDGRPGRYSRRCRAGSQQPKRAAGRGSASNRGGRRRGCQPPQRLHFRAAQRRVSHAGGVRRAEYRTKPAPAHHAVTPSQSLMLLNNATGARLVPRSGRPRFER